MHYGSKYPRDEEGGPIKKDGTIRKVVGRIGRDNFGRPTSSHGKPVTPAEALVQRQKMASNRRDSGEADHPHKCRWEGCSRTFRRAHELKNHEKMFDLAIHREAAEWPRKAAKA
jgi:hypothetical protein